MMRVLIDAVDLTEDNPRRSCAVYSRTGRTTYRTRLSHRAVPDPASGLLTLRSYSVLGQKKNPGTFPHTALWAEPRWD